MDQSSVYFDYMSCWKSTVQVLGEFNLVRVSPP